MNIGQLVASLGVDTKGLYAAEVAMKQFEKRANISMATVNSSLASVGARMQNFGRSATMYLTIPIALAGGAIIKAAKDFEISMQHIVGLVGISQNQVDMWSKEILSLSGKIARPPEELAKALYFVTSSGIKGAEALNVVTESAKAASAGLGETMVVADLVTSAMNAYKGSGLTATRALDVLTAAVREGKGEANLYATQMGEVIPIASKMGVGFDQVAAAMSAMTLTGTNVSEAATYMRQILTSLLDPAKESEKALERMGTSGLELRRIIREQGLLLALTKLNDLTNRFGEDMMAKVFPNVRALTGVLSLMGDRLNENRGIFERVNKSSGDMAKAYQSVANTIEYKYNQAMANMKVGFIEIGMSMKSIIIPMLERLGNTVRGLANWYTNLNDTQRKIIVTTAGILAVIGPLSITMSVMAKVMANVIMMGSKLLPLISGLVGPWGLIAAGITVAIIAFSNWNKTTNEFSKFQKELNNQLSDEVFKLNDVFNRLKQTNLSTQQRADAIKIVNDRYGSYLSNLLTEKSTLQDIEKAQRQATNALVASMSLKAYKEKLDVEMSTISKSFDKYFSDFLSGFSKTYGGDRVGEFITGIFEGADKAIKEGNPLQTSQELYDEFVEGMSKRTGYLKYNIEDFRKAFLNFVQVKTEKNQVVNQINAMISAYEKLLNVEKKERETIPDKKQGKSLFELERGINVLKQYEAHMKEAEWWRELYTPIDELQEKIDSLDYRKLLMFASDVGGPMAELSAKLADIALKNATFGDSMDTIGDQANYVKQVMQNLWDQGFRPGDSLMDMYIQKLNQLNDVQNKSIIYFDNVKEAIMSIARAFENVSSIEDFANAVIQAARDMIIAMITAAVVENTAKAVRGSKTWWGAIVQGAAAIAATYALFATIPKFGKGGKVPPGYPNDTYPAMLTSGETVTPAGKKLSIERQSSVMEGEVVFRISGYELVGVLEKQNKKTKVL